MPVTAKAVGRREIRGQKFSDQHNRKPCMLLKATV